jgi:hypothetical protein
MVDDWANKWPRATSWITYDYFLLARYPHLRPNRLRYDEFIRKEHISYSKVSPGKEYFDLQLAEQQELLDNCNKRILRKLDPEQRNQLSALVYELTIHFEEHIDYAGRLRELKKQSAQVKRAERVTARAMARINTELKQLSKIGESIGDAVGVRILAEAQKQMSKSVDDLGWSPEQLDGRLQTLNSSYLAMFVEDPSTLSMVQLYWLLLSFGLSVGESELRVGLIRNGLWNCWVGPVRCVTRRLGDQMIGCDAVRKAVRRFQFPKGTTCE